MAPRSGSLKPPFCSHMRRLPARPLRSVPFPLPLVKAASWFRSWCGHVNRVQIVSSHWCLTEGRADQRAHDRTFAELISPEGFSVLAYPRNLTKLLHPLLRFIFSFRRRGEELAKIAVSVLSFLFSHCAHWGRNEPICCGAADRYEHAHCVLKHCGLRQRTAHPNQNRSFRVVTLTYRVLMRARTASLLLRLPARR